MAGLLDWVDPAREWFKGRPEAVKGLLGAVYQMATDPQARQEAMSRYPVFDRSQSGQQMIDNALNAGPSGLLGKIVWHGSPHKFDRFDASKIGTGEGAQAYGHGVYLADSQGVARDYQNKLGGGDTYLSGDLAHKDGTSSLSLKFDYPETVKTDGQALAVDAMSRFGSPKDAIGFIETRSSAFGGPSMEVKREAIELLKSGVVEYKPKGSLYKADLPDEWIPKMLDWDKPLKDHSESVKKVITDIYPNLPKRVWDDSGGYFYRVYGRPDEAAHSVDASKFLAAKGIPGIRYLDGGSRSAGQGSYNYVVFPGLEDQVKILERNGVPLSGLLGR